MGYSKRLKTKGVRYAGFHWQGGYGLFSISPPHRAALEKYIGHQAEHHRVLTNKGRKRNPNLKRS